MPQRVFRSDRPCYMHLGGGVILRGFQLDVMPPLPTPLDTTPQAAAYRAANRDKMRSVDMFYIRYGTAERFAAPQAYVYPAGENDCTQPMPVAWQTSNEERGTDGRPRYGNPDAGAYNWPELGTHESEDCLFLVIWRPSDKVDRPGLMHIHGGGWSVNSPMAPQHYGDFLAADQGITVACPGYRLSTLGHFPMSGLAVAGDPSVAYLDIKLALKWLHDNAVAVGINRLTVSGTSAGGAATLMLMEDPQAQPWFGAAWADSGGGDSPYLGPEFYGPWTERFARVVRATGGVLSSDQSQYRSVADAIAATSLPSAMRRAMRPEHVQAFADNGPIVTAASVKAAIAGTGPLVVTRRNSPINPYPYRPTYLSASPAAAARAGLFQKPLILSYAECEPYGPIGPGSVAGLRDALLAIPQSSLNEWSRRLGFANYAGYVQMWSDILTPFGFGSLKELSSSLLRTEADGDAETRRVLYSHAVFGWAAWRIARAMAEDGDAPSWLVLKNFAANEQWSGHSTIIQMMFGNTEWSVGAGADFPESNPPGRYAAIYMDAIYMAGIVMRKLAAFCATGNPDGAYAYADGFDLFAGNPPADGGSLAGAWTPYQVAQPAHHNTLGKAGDPVDNLNAATPTLLSQRDAKTTYEPRMGAAFLRYLANLEP